MCDLLEARLLLLAQVSFELNGALDAMHVSFRSACALKTITRMNSLLAQMHCHPFEWPAFSFRVQPGSHRDATAKRGQQQRVRIRARIFTAYFDGLIGDEGVASSVANLILQV